MRGFVMGVVLALALVAAPVAGAASAPGLSGSISNDPNLSGTSSVAISGHFAYTTAYSAGELTAVDLSNPARPVVAGSSAFANALLNASTVNVIGGFAYVVSKNRNGPCLPGPYPMCGSGTNDDGTGNSLTILDISTNPAQPQIVHSVTDATKLFGAYGVAVSGHYAYIAAQGCLSRPQPCPNPGVGNSFEVVDVSDPTNPMIVASLRNSALPAPFTGSGALSHACSVTISGHYAYVTAAGSAHLTIIDIATPTAPKIVSSFVDPAIKFPVDVAVKGNFAYLADQGASLGRVEVVDVTDPTNPHLGAMVTDLATLNGAYRIRVSGNFAYVSASSVATVTAIDISNPLSPREAGHVTDTTKLNKTTGLDVAPGSNYVVASSPYTPTQSNPTFPPYSSAAVTGTISVIGLDPVAIGVSIASAPANPTTQTSATFTFATTDAISSVLCGLDGAPLGFCTTATTQLYSGLAPGTHTFTVQAADAAGALSSQSYSWTIGRAPVNTVAPSISGPASPSQGDHLTASNGTWSGVPAPSFAYQWSDCDSGGGHCAAISGATSPSYTAQAFDVRSALEVTVTGSNGAGSSSATSAHTAVVTSTVPVIAGLHQSARIWRSGAKLAHLTAAPGQRSQERPRLGTSFSFGLNQSASVKFTFSQHLSGRRVNGRCRRSTAHHHGRSHCKLSVREGQLVLAAHRGANQLSFAGRLSRARKLRPGQYTLSVTATAGGKTSKPRTIGFTIVS